MSDRQKRKESRLLRKRSDLKEIAERLKAYHPSTFFRIIDYGYVANFGNHLYYNGRPVTVRFDLSTLMMNRRVTKEHLFDVGKRFIDNALLQCDKDESGKSYYKSNNEFLSYEPHDQPA